MKVLLAGLVGGVVFFAAGAVLHILTPLAHVGLSAMDATREGVVIEVMKSAMNERRIYRFPGWDFADPQSGEKEPYKSRNASGPTGLIVYAPGPGLTSMAQPLAVEFATNVIEGLIAAYIVASLAVGTSYFKRVLIVALIGVSASFSIDASYWNWYRFPTEYFEAQLVMTSVGALLSGLVIAKLAAPRAS
jgi:hypothetical protein